MSSRVIRKLSLWYMTLRDGCMVSLDAYAPMTGTHGMVIMVCDTSCSQRCSGIPIPSPITDSTKRLIPRIKIDRGVEPIQ